MIKERGSPSKDDDAAIIARVAANSDNEAVQIALDHLKVVTQLAHPDEIKVMRFAHDSYTRVFRRLQDRYRNDVLDKASRSTAYQAVVQKSLARMRERKAMEEAERHRKARESRSLKALWQRITNGFRG